VKTLTDLQIIGLYESRSESAISETQSRYGGYCLAIAANILGSREDAQEVANDAYLAAWNAIPPARPEKLASYLGRIVRNLSLNRCKAKAAAKRGGESGADLLLSELEACLPSSNNVEDAVAGNETARAIDTFLQEQGEGDSAFFIRRYWYGDTVPQIAKRYGAGESKVKVSLHRTRKKLKAYLEEREIMI
jgi:RNA polymerase sigma-70 factor (ECF subfamily)